MKLKKIISVLKDIATIILIVLGINWIRKQFERGDNKKRREERKKIKKNMKDGAGRFGRPLLMVVFLLLVMVSSTTVTFPYTNWNYEENKLWYWYSKDSYIGYTQWYITNQKKLIATYEEPSWLKRMWEKYDIFVGILAGILVYRIAIK